MKTTDTILDKIIADKRAVLEAQKQQRSQAALEQAVEGLATPKGSLFFDALKQPGITLIAEAKKASPSAGVLRQPFSLDEVNNAYQSATSVAAISVITEEKHFQGSPYTLAYFAQHNTNHKPLLRKDFIFDEYQILEAKLLGARAYLLIVSLFDQAELAHLVDFGLEQGLEPLVEVHDQQELDMALKTKARCIGVNARDLKDFSIDRSRHELLKQLDDTYVRIAESGIDTPDYLQEVSVFSDAALVGTQFMKAPDIKQAIDALTGVKV